MEKYIGLDLGTKSLGIAVCDSLGIIHPRENYNFEKGNYKKAREHLIDILEIENIKNVVIGLPLRLEGRVEGDRCESVRRFMTDILKVKPNLNVIYWDESYSTIEARERLKDEGLKEEKIKKIIDMMSAVVILEDYLRSLKNGTKK
ncbi:MAG: Holliday junction resolvase RuvX [Bacilli bacterium]|nr:Holliday junction resolvase RuvX [Bacilli bacterium]